MKKPLPSIAEVHAYITHISERIDDFCRKAQTWLQPAVLGYIARQFTISRIDAAVYLRHYCEEQIRSNSIMTTAQHTPTNIMCVLPLTHTSPETAYVIEDYPYSFNLRCQKRMWIEHRPKYGYRVMAQTTNPRKPGIVWNKPHAGIYHSMAVLYLNTENHVCVDALSMYSSSAEIEQFLRTYVDAFTDDREETAALRIWARLKKTAEEAYARKNAR